MTAHISYQTQVGHALSSRYLFRAHGLSVHDISGARARYELVPEDDAQVVFVFSRRGEAFVTATEHPVDLLANRRHGVLLSSRDTVTVVLDEPAHAQAVSVASSALRRRGVQVRERLAAVAPDSLLVAAILSLVDIDPRGVAVSDRARETLARIGTDLIVGAMDEASAPTPRGLPPHDRFTAARAVILARRQDPSFNVDVLCRELALSRRQLNRVFEAEGTTAVAELRRARLDLLESFRADPRNAGRRLSALAGLSGFRSGAALRRALASDRDDPTAAS
ncbi:hypothetical protein [Microbacterium sp.]|uniref:hypothetical protein n=1 Tax=Microbacterium sp. TaxID=51671 RepID=UPI0033419846